MWGHPRSSCPAEDLGWVGTRCVPPTQKPLVQIRRPHSGLPLLACVNCSNRVSFFESLTLHPSLSFCLARDNSSPHAPCALTHLAG